MTVAHQRLCGSVTGIVRSGLQRVVSVTAIMKHLRMSSVNPG